MSEKKQKRPAVFAPQFRIILYYIHFYLIEKVKLINQF